MRNLIGVFAMLAAAVSGFQTAQANPQLAFIPGARVNMAMEEPFSIKGARIPYEHEVTVYLPASYEAQPERAYPVLWVLDAPLLLRAVVGVQDILVTGNFAPEMIIVGIGSRSEEGLAGVGRRVMDFSPPGPDYFPQGLRGDRWKEVAPLPKFPHRADSFLNFLVDQLRPSLAERYRFSGDHGLFGHSAGGMFAAYALVTRPDSFDKYIIGSPYIEGVRGAVMTAEAQYARDHDDMEAAVYIAAGGREADTYFLAASGIVSGTVDFSETLRLRRYPSLTVSTRLYDDANHYTIVPRLLMDGISELWADDFKDLPSSWPQPPG
ncbi:MAG: alpha/beta hydrolase-fold protein [Pseudomonadota bacterium]